jgi:hypothetical protein
MSERQQVYALQLSLEAKPAEVYFNEGTAIWPEHGKMGYLRNVLFADRLPTTNGKMARFRSRGQMALSFNGRRQIYIKGTEFSTYAKSARKCK